MILRAGRIARGEEEAPPDPGTVDDINAKGSVVNKLLRASARLQARGVR